MQSPFRQIDYDKLSDDIMLLGPNTVVRFNVILSKQLKDGRRFHFHQEYEYQSSKYTDYKNLVTLRRQFDYYLSIENIRTNEFGVKEYIQIRAKDMIYVIDQLNKIYAWFTDPKYVELFAYREQQLIVYERVDSIIIQLSMDKYLKAEPSIVHYSTGDKVGIRLYLSSEDNFIDVDVDKFMELYYFITTFNMYQSAQLLINYLERPEYGTNRYTFDAYNRQIELIENTEGFIETKQSTKRTVESKNKKQKSFFDRIDELK